MLPAALGLIDSLRSASAPRELTEGVEGASGKLERHAPKTPVERAAVENGFPDDEIELVGPIVGDLERAVAEATLGNIVSEERHLRDARRQADSAGFGHKRKVRSWLDGQIQEFEQSGSLRRKSRLIGTVGSALIVRSDRILYNHWCYVLDALVEAAVELDGQLIESARPTMTRMGIGSVLPGSALLVGMATAKKETTDTRVANFLVVHPDWRIVVKIKPSSVPSYRPLAVQINAISRKFEIAASAVNPVERLSVGEPTDEAGRVAAEPTPNLEMAFSERMDQLERIAAMKQSGVLSEAEADRLRKEVLG